MARPFLRFEDGKITLNNKDLMVNSANLSIAPSMSVEKVYGDYDASIGGARTEFVGFAPTQNLKGQLNISFYISSDVVSPNSVDRLFELIDVANPSNLKNTISEAPIHGNVVGRYGFDNMFLTSFSFQMSPFQLIVANATYDIYGTISSITDRYFSKSDVDFAHAMKSFGQVKISNQESDEQFEIAGLRYNINVERKISNKIRENENTAINTYAGGALPNRVSVESITSEATIECNDMIDNLNPYGDQQFTSNPATIPDSAVDVFMYSLGGERISRFQCQGKIQNQNVAISEGSYAKSSITIKQIIK
tara:strand:- start:6563 stop:7483 length:921 start_codon:yes stop_codon:yes gene_type:complete